MQQQIKTIISVISLSILLPTMMLAADTDTVPFNTKDSLGWGDMSSLTLADHRADPAEVVINLTNIALAFLGMLASGMILYAGITWFFARDNEEQTEKAKNILKGAVVGLFMVLMSYGISYLLWLIINQ